MEQPNFSPGNIFTFLDLPPELRIEIYHYLLPIGDTYLSSVSHTLKPISAKLLRVCKQIRDEVAPILHGKRRYAFYIFPPMDKMVSQIRELMAVHKAALPFMRNVEFHFKSSEERNAGCGCVWVVSGHLSYLHKSVYGAKEDFIEGRFSIIGNHTAPCSAEECEYVKDKAKCDKIYEQWSELATEMHPNASTSKIWWSGWKTC